jgi:hypothetical protein
MVFQINNLDFLERHTFEKIFPKIHSRFLPTITIKAKDFSKEITTINSARDNLQGEKSITKEHVKNNTDVCS